ncbi:MAG: acetyl-CoA carboxylase carboxyltransferase subunit [Candidatus Melainabacteria bacterium HGW-Melainabacteria-1]|nr:MAG: acetyl-CoA carboxylase carboxyltransferase subunit [Candidatus Melainabacteria bacterium HGW-Melainabacteria-1]
MSVYHSSVNPQSADYQSNYQAMLEIVADMEDKLKGSLYQGEDKYKQRHIKSGKLLARERIELLLDPDSYFLELMSLAGAAEPGNVPGAGVITGLGVISGVECAINASVPTIKGGAMNPMTLKKALRLDAIAAENRLPMVYLIESAGADLTRQSELFDLGGVPFRNMAQRSRQNIPSFSVVFGPCVAGGSFFPAMSEHVIMVQHQARAFLAASPLVKMATGEITDDESLGGADMHSRVSGLSDDLALDEHDALLKAREAIAYLNWQKLGPEPRDSAPPKYNSEEILGIVSADLRKPFEVREIIARMVDKSAFSEFKPLFGPTLVTCFAHVHGYPVGIIANNGVLFSEAANKGVQFIQLCNQRNIPLIFLQNTTGFIVGQTYEEKGIVKHGGQLINALANSAVPAITIVIGASYGAGNFGMCGRPLAPRFIFSWPNAKTAVMGPEQLSGVLAMIQRQAGNKFGTSIDEAAIQAKQLALQQKVEFESSAYHTSSILWDDGVIDPRDTRDVLGIVLSNSHSGEIKGTESYGMFRV